MPKTQYLFKRGNIWYLRLRVPTDLLAAYKPKKEITLSLHTQDLTEAKKRVTIAKADLEAKFEATRKQLKAQSSGTDALALYSDHELRALASKWMAEARNAEEERRIKGISETWSEERKADFYIELQQEAQAAKEEVLNTSHSEEHQGMTIAARFLQSEGLSFNTQSDNFKKAGYFFSKAINELAQERLREWQGKSVPNLTVVNQKALKQVSIKMLCDEYITDPGKKLSQSTQNNYRIIFRALYEIVGEHAPVQSITRQHCREIQRLIIDLPTNTTKRVGKSPLKKAGILAQKNGWQLMAPATVNMYLHKLHALLEFAVREEYLDKNPARNLTIPDKVKKKDKRDPFSNEQLQKIFNAPLYTGCVNDNAGYNKPGPHRPRNTRFWIPLIGLWTGMRMNEICQLRTKDISSIRRSNFFI